MSPKPEAYLNYANYLLGSIAVSNKDLHDKFPSYSEEKIFTTTGVKKRFTNPKGTLSSDFGVACAEDFFKKFSVKKTEIDFLIFCTEVPDYIAPATSCIVQHKLGLKTSIGTLDLSFGCSGYTYGLSIAKALVESGIAKNILFICADHPTSVIPADNSILHFLFSDGASTNLISSNTIGPSIKSFIFGTDGSGEREMMVKNSGLKEAKNKEWFSNQSNSGLQMGRMEMNGEAVFNFALSEIPQLIKETLKKNKLKFEDVDFFVFHQASRIILKTLKRKLKIPDEKFLSNLEFYGNTVSSSIPIELIEAEQNSLIKKGMRVLIVGFGIGFSCSGTILEY